MTWAILLLLKGVDFMQKRSEVFWPFSRMMISETAYQREFGFQRSFITYNILFGGPLVIRDSDYLNNYLLRKELISSLHDESKNSHFVRSLFEKGLLRLACREETPLSTLARNLSTRGGAEIILKHAPWMFEGRRSADIEYFLDNEIIQPYTRSFSLSDASKYYENEIERLFRDTEFGGKLPTNTALLIHDLIRERREDGIGIDWAFLAEKGEVWESVRKRIGDKACSPEYRKFVYYVAQAPHTTFLPETHGLNSIYSDDHSMAIDLWRGRMDIEAEEVESFELNSKGLSFSDYADALKYLDTDAIVKLVESEERIEFEKACLNIKVDNDIKSVSETYSDYRKIIDEAILSKNSARLKSGRNSRIRILAGKLEPWVFLAVTEPVSGLLKFALNVVQISKTQNDVVKNENASRKGERIIASEVLSEVSQGTSFESKTHISKEGMRDTCVTHRGVV